MQTSLSGYVAEKLAEDIRADPPKPISAKLCEAIYDSMYHDPLRKQLTHEDFAALQRLCESREGAVQTLGISMLRHLMGEVDVYHYVQTLWERDDLAFEARVAVQHRLLDRADLSQAWHDKLFAFTLQHWDKWLKLCGAYAGGPAHVLAWCKKRLDDKDFLESKKWTYLCIAAASDDPDGARMLIEKYRALTPFMDTVAAEVLTRI